MPDCLTQHERCATESKLSTVLAACVRVNLAASGEVLDVAVASMLSARDGPGSLLSSFLELVAVFVHAAQQAPNGLRQVGCTRPGTESAG